MTAVWIRLTTIRAEIERGRVRADGEPALARSMRTWLGLSPFAGEPKRAVGEGGAKRHALVDACADDGTVPLASALAVSCCAIKFRPA